MTIRAIASVSSVAPDAGQKSLSKEFAPVGGRGRDCRTARRGRDAHALKCNMAVLWRRYVRLAYRSREDLRADFDVTFQTACNWWDGAHAPSSAAYARAALQDGVRLHAVMVGGL